MADNQFGPGNIIVHHGQPGALQRFDERASDSIVVSLAKKDDQSGGQRRQDAGFSKQKTVQHQGGESGIDTIENRDLLGGANHEINHLLDLTDQPATEQEKPRSPDQG